MGIIDTVYPDGVAVQKSNVRADDKTGHRRTVADANAIRNNDFSGQFGGLYAFSLKAFYDIDTSDTTSPDDGDDCIVDSAGNRFKRISVGGADDPTTTEGDIIVRGASALERLALGTAGYLIGSTGSGKPLYLGQKPSGTGAVERSWNVAFDEVWKSVKAFGAKGDCASVTATVSITSGAAALTATGASFTAGDVGKTIVIPGAGTAGAQLITTILAFTDAAHLTLAANAATTLTTASKSITYGTDDTIPINRAIAALPVTGGMTHFPVGMYLTTDAIVIGDGTSSTFSTRYGVYLCGAAPSIDPPIHVNYPNSPSVQITWAGAAGGSVIDVKGPLRGWGVSNMRLLAGPDAAYGIRAKSAAVGDINNVAIWGAQSVGYLLDCYSTSGFPGTTNVNTERCRAKNLFISLGTASGAAGVKCHGNADGTSAACFNTFEILDIVFGSIIVQQYGIYLGVCDTNTFIGAHVYGSCHATSISVVSDYTSNDTFPSANMFFSLDPGNQGGLAFATGGSPGVGSQPNKIYGLSLLNAFGALSMATSSGFEVVDGLVDVGTTGQVAVYAGNGRHLSGSSTPAVTSLRSPLLMGGTGTASFLDLESTSGAGATGGVRIKTGSQVTRWTVDDAAGNLVGTATTNATSTSAAAIVTPGGIAAAKDILSGGKVTADETAGVWLSANKIIYRSTFYTVIGTPGGPNAYTAGNASDPTTYLTNTTTKIMDAAFSVLFAQFDATRATMNVPLQFRSYTVATLPTGATGDAVWASNCRVFNGAGVQEGAGSGTGGLVTKNASAWKIAGTNITAVA